ncbi:MAG: NAD-dependent succinate-semialdehyde dehydrogenase [Myxococcota bacterium]
MLSDKRLLRTDCYIGGEWVSADSQFEVRNPATGEGLAEVADADAALARRAVESATGAWPGWRSMLAKERTATLRRWFDLVLENLEDLAQLMTLEQGKPLTESRGEVRYGAAFIEWFGEEAKRVYGDTIPNHGPGKRIVVMKEPVGVVAAVTPWNFPIAMITRKAGAALAAGCTFVVKPAEDTPLCALALAELADRAGLPGGVFNVVPTSRPAPVGEVLTTDPRVRKFSFTGSTAVGKRLLGQCATTVKKVSMELGGNAPFIVFEDADIDAAVQGAMASKYRNAGQTCVCANRILVQRSVHDAFVEKLAAEVSRLRVGNGLDEGVTIGPLIHRKAANEVESKVADALGAGAKAVVGGGGAASGPNFFEPTVLTGVNEDMRVFNEEIFGPVAPVLSFEDEAHALSMANATPFGLAAYFYSRDVGRVWRVMEGLEYGMVACNDGMLSTEVAPFGGMKESGLGREGSYYGIDDYVEVKYGLFGGL